MGGSVSTRKITLANDERTGVIKVSENLAHRLRGQIDDNQSNEPAAPHPLRPPPTPPRQSLPPRQGKEPSLTPPPPEMNTFREDSVAANGFGGAYAKEARRAVLRLQEEQDQALEALDNKWRQTMQDREQQFVETSKLTLSELEKTVSEVEGTFVSSAVIPVCQDSQSAVLQCYRDHPQQTLKCSSAVKQFTRCVDLTRLVSTNVSTNTVGQLNHVEE